MNTRLCCTLPPFAEKLVRRVKPGKLRGIFPDIISAVLRCLFPGVSLVGAVLPSGAATVLINGSFDADLTGWQRTAAATAVSGIAVLTDAPGGSAAGSQALYQTADLTVAPVASWRLQFSFLNAGLSIFVGPGGFPDTAFLSLYLGDAPFGSPDAPVFAQAVPLFDLDWNGVRNLAAGLTISNHPSRVQWRVAEYSFTSSHPFATIVTELFGLNGAPGDSTLAVDEFILEPAIIPEPSVPLLAFAAGILLVNRRRRRPLSCHC